MKKNITLLFIVIILLTGCTYRSVDKDFDKIDLTGIDNLMIVAHPDDETLFGGAHLIRDNYLVVCITCGNNKTRDEEIKEVLRITDDKLIKLGYPDKVMGQRSDWKDDIDNINNDLKKILSLKKWNLIVTHNKKGEYGHNQHILANNIVSNLYNDLKLDSDLYFFGKYYSKKKMDSLLEIPEEISEKELAKKEELLKIYKSQESTIDKLKHMNRFEDWTRQE